jgi:hypothetical protein
VTLPVNWDFFTSLVINLMNLPLFQQFAGNLDGLGGGTAGFGLFQVDPGMIGLEFTLAFALRNPWDFVSNPVQIEVVP